MKTKLPQEYDQEKKAIKEKYEKKGGKIIRNYAIGVAAACILVGSSVAIKDIKSKNLEKNSPIYQEYRDNQNSLRYLKNELNQQSEKFPEFLSKDIKNELENISIQENFTKISSLEKLVKISEQDNDRIVNTSEFKEYSEKREKIKNAKIFYLLGVGSLWALLPGFVFLNKFYRKRRDKELKALDKEYGLVPEEPQDSTQSSQ